MSVYAFWRLGLVLGNVKHSAEEQAIRDAGIEVVKLTSIIAQLNPKKRSKARSGLVLDAASGYDLSELLWAHQSLKREDDE